MLQQVVKIIDKKMLQGVSSNKRKKKACKSELNHVHRISKYIKRTKLNIQRKAPAAGLVSIYIFIILQYAQNMFIAASRHFKTTLSNIRSITTNIVVSTERMWCNLERKRFNRLGYRILEVVHTTEYQELENEQGGVWAINNSKVGIICYLIVSISTSIFIIFIPR